MPVVSTITESTLTNSESKSLFIKNCLIAISKMMRIYFGNRIITKLSKHKVISLKSNDLKCFSFYLVQTSDYMYPFEYLIY